MKKIFLISLLISVFLTPLFAKSYLIRVISVTDTDILFNVQYRLQEMGYKMYLTEYENWHNVYTGPFKNRATANKALSGIKKNISYDANILPYATSTKPTQSYKVKNKPKIIDEIIEPLYVEEIIEEEIIEPLYEEEEVYTPKSREFFVGLNVGSSNFNVNENRKYGDLNLDIDLKSSGYNYAFEGGYYLSRTSFISVSYQRSELENISFDNFFASLNYKFKELYSVNPSFGILAGYGTMNWKNHPIDSLKSTATGYSYLFGAELRAERPVGSDISLYIFYRYMTMDYMALITTQSAQTEIEHTSKTDINAGIKYNF